MGMCMRWAVCACVRTLSCEPSSKLTLAPCRSTALPYLSSFCFAEVRSTGAWCSLETRALAWLGLGLGLELGLGLGLGLGSGCGFGFGFGSGSVLGLGLDPGVGLVGGRPVGNSSLPAQLQVELAFDLLAA